MNQETKFPLCPEKSGRREPTTIAAASEELANAILPAERAALVALLKALEQIPAPDQTQMLEKDHAHRRLRELTEKWLWRTREAQETVLPYLTRVEARTAAAEIAANGAPTVVETMIASLSARDDEIDELRTRLAGFIGYCSATSSTPAAIQAASLWATFNELANRHFDLERTVIFPRATALESELATRL